MNKLIAATLAGFAALATPTLSNADTRVYVGIGLPVAPVIVESRHHHYSHSYGHGAPVYYREPVIYYAPVRHRGRGHDRHYDEHRHDRHCRHDDRRHDRRDGRDGDRYWRGQDDDRGHWRGDDHRRHRDRRH